MIPPAVPGPVRRLSQEGVYGIKAGLLSDPLHGACVNKTLNPHMYRHMQQGALATGKSGYRVAVMGYMEA